MNRRPRSYSALQDAARRTLDKGSDEYMALRRVRRDLMRSLGAKSMHELTPQQVMLVEHASVLTVVTATMASRALADGIVNQRGHMNRLMKKQWLPWHNTLLRCLWALAATKSGKGGTGSCSVSGDSRITPTACCKRRRCWFNAESVRDVSPGMASTTARQRQGRDVEGKDGAHL